MRGFLYLMTSGVCFGLLAILIKLVGNAVSPFTLTFFRVLIASLFILSIVVAQKKSKELKLGKGDMRTYSILGFVGVTLSFGLFVAALYFAPVANVVLLDYTSIAMVAVLSFIFLKEKITKQTIFAITVCFLGIVLLVYDEFAIGSQVLIGNLLALGGSICFAIYVILTKYEEKLHPFYDVVFWPFTFGCFFLIPFSMAEGMYISVTPPILLLVLGIGTLTGMAYLLYDFAMEVVESHIAVILVSISHVLSAILLAFLVLGESLTQNTFLGGILILSAGIIIQNESRR